MARVQITIVFESGARIGPGKAKLLESIRDSGSISAAARDMGMSYKRAWMLLDSINRAFTEPVVTAAPGGAGGGGARLTPFGDRQGPEMRSVRRQARLCRGVPDASDHLYRRRLDRSRPDAAMGGAVG
jgi:molybdate transport system regulatory protein